MPAHCVPGELAHAAGVVGLWVATAIIAATVPSLRHSIIGGVECRWAYTARRAAADRGEGELVAQLTKQVVRSALAGQLDDHLGYHARTDA